MSPYYRKMAEITEIPAPDDLTQSSYCADVVALASPGAYKRGLLLMKGEGGFIPATSAGLAGAEEICICAENIEFTEGTAAVSAYFGGIFNGECVVLDWEQEGDVHSELIIAIKAALRSHKIFIV